MLCTNENSLINTIVKCTHFKNLYSKAQRIPISETQKSQLQRQRPRKDDLLPAILLSFHPTIFWYTTAQLIVALRACVVVPLSGSCISIKEP